MLGLGFWETVVVLAVGNAIGVTIFGAFVPMGQRTGVTQMLLTRSAFGRRGAYLPAPFQLVIATGWIAVNTWIVLDLSIALFTRLGLPDTTLATLGFYAIRTFGKLTVPIKLLVLVTMSLVAWTGRRRVELRRRSGGTAR